MAFLPAGLGLASGVLAGLSLFGEPRPPVRPPPLRVKVYILPAPGYYGGGDPGYYGGGAPGYYGGGRGTKKEKKKKKPHGKGSAGYQGVFGKHDVLAASGERHLCSQKLNLQSEEESDEEESESDESESESDSEEEDESDDEETVHQPAGRAYY